MCASLVLYLGRGGGPWAAEEDAAAGERPGPDPGEADERQPAPGREGEGTAECKSPEFIE